MSDSKSELIEGLHPDRKKLITEIQNADQQVFEDWVSKSKAFRKLPTEAEILRYLIPPRIWDFVADPRRLDVLVTEREGKHLEFSVVEHTDQPLTNINSLKKHDEELRKLRDERSAARNEKPTYPKLPPDVDEFHWEQIDYVLEGIIPVTDKIYNLIYLQQIDDELHVVAYSDREELQRKGVATSVYQRLREAGKKLGFRYITGENSEENKSFFKERLGRISFSELPENLKSYFESHHGGQNFFDEDFTVDFINPEDKPQPNKQQ